MQFYNPKLCRGEAWRGRFSLKNMEEIKYFLEAMQTQTNSLVVLSTGAMGFIIYTWLRVANVFGDSAAPINFQRRYILAISLIGFAICVVSGHKINTYATGFYFEVLKKTDLATGAAITDARVHFQKNYLQLFERFAEIQMLFYAASMTIFMLWFAFNIWKRERA